MHAQVRVFNPKYKEAERALVGEFQRFHSDIYGNRDFLTALRNQQVGLLLDGRKSQLQR